MDKYIGNKRIIANGGLDKLFDPYILEDGTMISAMESFHLVKTYKTDIKIDPKIIIDIDKKQKSI